MGGTTLPRTSCLSAWPREWSVTSAVMAVVLKRLSGQSRPLGRLSLLLGRACSRRGKEMAGE